MAISWRCARDHLTTRRADLAYDETGKCVCKFCREEDDAKAAAMLGMTPEEWRREMAMAEFVSHPHR